MAAAENGGVDWKAVHSIVRWNKPLEEIAEVVLTPEHCNCVDTKNGNYPIHIAAQNGHTDLVIWLVENGAKTNVQNGTGQTAMHMSTSCVPAKRAREASVA
jgi:ankyrin repeat protein